MNKKAVLIVAGVSLVLLLVLGYFRVNVWSRFDASIYAPGFSESKFRKIEKNMSKTEVQAILGKPVTTINGFRDEDIWVYADPDDSKIPHDDRVVNTWFTIRKVYFNGVERVEKTESYTEYFE